MNTVNKYVEYIILLGECRTCWSFHIIIQVVADPVLLLPYQYIATQLIYRNLMFQYIFY